MSVCKKKVSCLLLGLVVLVLSGCGLRGFPEVNVATGTNGVVVSSHPAASEIGLNVLKDGGNAIDAAVAMGMALGVVDQFNSGLGGGGFMVMRLADGTVYTVDGRERAPAAATRDMYVRNGRYDPDLSRVGVLSVAVPGLLAAYVEALELAGTRSLADLTEPSIAVAEDGFRLDPYYLSRYNLAADLLKNDPESAAIYFHSDGSPLKAGDLLKQPDLARTYRKIASRGMDYFYRGEFTEQLASYMAAHGGLITHDDMADYRAVLREPVVGEYRDYTVIGMAPPSSGGVHVVEILNMIEASGILQGKSSWDPESIYWSSQFMRQAFADRAVYLGDSDYFPVPVDRLISQSYADSLVWVIMSDGRADVQKKRQRTAVVRGNTTNTCVVDRWGNAVAVNQTVNLRFGGKMTLPGTGIILNNQMDDFSASPGVPNFFDLVGNRANAIEPGKRPLSSMSPTIVVSRGRPVMILGGAGGPKIITAVVETMIDVLDFHLSLEEALTEPRFHPHPDTPVLYMEDTMPGRLRRSQRRKGQEVVIEEELGRVQAIAWSEIQKAYVGVADPRSGGAAAGY
ncbi:MAG: gamma-glutamyltransferase [Fidelibacterota bacterium]